MKYEDFRLKMTATPLYIRAKIELIKMIKSGVFKGNKLPPENKLSEILGISRTSIREALMALSKEGIITKKQGIGNLYHLSALDTKMRIDQINCFEDL
ncbi:MAG: winged helix-turn-helix transcriptional regulator, partial [Spirochaetales bacterium]|nr:winged helix-turn-helix transcriptional regulator [Spirochaetales bacterium]